MKRSSDGGATWQIMTICYLGDYQQSNSSIHTFEPKQTFRAVDYNEYDTLKQNALLTSDKTEITNWGTPDYSSVISGVGNNYTAPKDGIYWFSLDNANNASVSITINGMTFTNVYNGYGTTGGYQVALAKGDTISFSSTAFEYTYFIPLKGAK